MRKVGSVRFAKEIIENMINRVGGLTVYHFFQAVPSEYTMPENNICIKQLLVFSKYCDILKMPEEKIFSILCIDTRYKERTAVSLETLKLCINFTK